MFDKHDGDFFELSHWDFGISTLINFLMAMNGEVRDETWKIQQQR